MEKILYEDNPYEMDALTVTFSTSEGLIEAGFKIKRQDISKLIDELNGIKKEFTNIR